MTPMPMYAILRFQKCKAGGVACRDRHNERKKVEYKSNAHSRRSSVPSSALSSASSPLRDLPLPAF